MKLHSTRVRRVKICLIPLCDKGKNNSFVSRTADSPPEAGTSVSHCQSVRKEKSDEAYSHRQAWSFSTSPQSCAHRPAVHRRFRTHVLGTVDSVPCDEWSPTVERALINWHTHLSSGTHCTTAKRSQPDFESLASHVTSHGEQPEFARDTSPTRPCSGTSVRQLATKLACRLAWKRIETVVRARASCQR